MNGYIANGTGWGCCWWNEYLGIIEILEQRALFYYVLSDILCKEIDHDPKYFLIGTPKTPALEHGDFCIACDKL